ncbi:hypothetical protein TrCOL_g6988, partial [Triparma columacea]
FDCSPDSLSVTVNGSSLGTINGLTLGSSFADIYLDKNGVSPTLKKSLEERCQELNEGN